MTYRERTHLCPKCGALLAQYDTREKWRCRGCNGVVLGITELVRELMRAAPEVLPDDGAAGVTTAARASDVPRRPCPACGEPMEPVMLGGVDLDRCYKDELVWFDIGELGEVVALAKDDAASRTKPWVRAVFRS